MDEDTRLGRSTRRGLLVGGALLASASVARAPKAVDARPRRAAGG
jgi:hypothetical protein